MKCKYGHEVESIETILSDVCRPEPTDICVSEGENIDDILGDEKFVVYLGFTERAVPCGHYLGEGYGDPNFFPTFAKAQEFFEIVILMKNQAIKDGVLNVNQKRR